MDSGLNSEIEDDFASMLEASFKKNNSNRIIKGVITQILPDKALVDAGFKSDAELNILELHDDNNELKYAVGDTIEIMITSHRSERPHVSHTKALKQKTKDDFIKRHAEDFANIVIKGTIVKKNKGGFIVSDGEMEFFMPKSHSMIAINANPIGKTIEAKIIKIEENEIVISKTELVKEQRNSKNTILTDYIDADKIAKGIVTNIVSYGMFVEFDGIVGLVHYNEISYKGSVNPSKYFKVGDMVDVKVIGYDKQKGHVTLSIKSTMLDPWDDLSELGVGDVIMVTVTNIEKYGAFVDIGNDIEGLLHISEMSWDKNFKNPKEIVSIGQEINVEIKELNIKEKKLRVSLKNLTPKPMDKFVSLHKSGDIVNGEVIEIKDFGAFVKIDGIEALLANQNCDWNKSVRCKDILKVGDKVDVKILEIDNEKEKVSLSIKDTKLSPAHDFEKINPEGTIVKGIIKEFKDFGVFVKVDDHEALIRKEDMYPLKIEELSVGDEIEAVVSLVEPRENKIRLSVRRLQKSKDKDAIERFNSDSKITFKDMLKAKN